MQAALVVHRVEADLAANFAGILSMAAEAVHCGAELLVFPEAALTGLVIDDDLSHDLPLGQEIPGPATKTLSSFCQKQHVWLAIGMLERDHGRLYDSAVLLDPNGSLRLKYRRNQPQWHGRNADPNVYRQGTDICKAQTPFGSAAFLICGDLFDDAIISRFRNLKPAWLLFPFARCFSDGSYDQQRWDSEEIPHYLDRVRMAGVPTLMVNYLGGNSLPEDKSFGGAFAVSAQGEVLASHALGEKGILIVDLEEMSNKRMQPTAKGRG